MTGQAVHSRPQVADDRVTALAQRGLTTAQIAERLGISRRSVQRALDRAEPCPSS